MRRPMLYHNDDQTIIAQCTPTGSGALALIRLSGIDALKIASSCIKLSGNKDINQVNSHTVHFGWAIDHRSNKKIDQIMAIVMHGPSTFTGQNTVEITCHNNQFLTEEIINVAIAAGARLAREGEFTQRAYINKKIDLTQAEAINELIHAQTQNALKKSLSQLEGSFSEWIVQIEQELLRSLAWSEASFEFLDDEAEFGTQIKKHLDALLITIQKVQKTFDLQQQIRQGIRIALIGTVNAGKSSLFNALLGHKRAIVSASAGTTRDIIEASIAHNGNQWTLIDTAGIRQTDNDIEAEGIDRSFAEAAKADVIVLVYDSSRQLTDAEQPVYDDVAKRYQNKVIAVLNKSDIACATIKYDQTISVVSVSTTQRTGIEKLLSAINRKSTALLETHDAPFLVNARQHKLLIALACKIQEIISLLDADAVAYELVSYHLRDALEHITELTGKTISEAGMDMVFREFCVGK